MTFVGAEVSEPPATAPGSRSGSQTATESLVGARPPGHLASRMCDHVADAASGRREREVDAIIQSLVEHRRTRTEDTPASALLPLTRIRGIMRQDLPERTYISSTGIETMAERAIIFVRCLTLLAWHLSVLPEGRSTLQARDLRCAIYASRRFDFLLDAVDIFEQNSHTPEYSLGISTFPARRAAAHPVAAHASTASAPFFPTATPSSAHLQLPNTHASLADQFSCAPISTPSCRGGAGGEVPVDAVLLGMME